MKWYNGGIVEAIAASKQKSAIFVVYIEGPDEKSTKFTELIDTPELRKLLEGDNFVAIKLEANSVPHQQFSDIYKNVSFPSLYFIGKAGQPLEIITEVTDASSLVEKIKNVLVLSGVKNSAGESSATLIQSEQGNNMPPNVVCENGVCTIRKPDTPGDGPTTEEKIARAKELVQQKNKQKELEEKEKERLKEIERRKMGQDVQQLKRWQEDQEMLKLKEERERERRENQAARDRVLAQIEQDKAERAAKFNQPSISPSAQAPSSSSSVSQRIVKSDVAKLQFKLPDGSTHTHEFPSGDKLRSVREHIAKNVALNLGAYTLSTTYPKRELTDVDDDRSLLELRLTPTAVVLILPVNRTGAVSTNQQSGFMGMIWFVLSPIVGLLTFLKGMVFGAPAGGQAGEPSTGPSSSYGASNRKPNSHKKPSTTVKKNKGSNIHRLADMKDSDDDTNTWNGNSTQQM
ncbi:UBX domain-containing protein 4 isoform X2 [Aethina tumida]|uniref:UBX domain-containing protein 4 isoform X2 n=1 Tax=Aethina tumida TaxID=116153 RepID=UPI00096ADFAD|nr:UBX domain-containing protein 4 isoform X2 [Aethina tumida]